MLPTQPKHILKISDRIPAQLSFGGTGYYFMCRYIDTDGEKVEAYLDEHEVLRVPDGSGLDAMIRFDKRRPEEHLVVAILEARESADGTANEYLTLFFDGEERWLPESELVDYDRDGNEKRVNEKLNEWRAVREQAEQAELLLLLSSS